VRKLGKATFLNYLSADGTADVVLCIVDGLGHQWPGGLLIPGLGPGSDDPSATKLIVDFFKTHVAAVSEEWQSTVQVGDTVSKRPIRLKLQDSRN
jgi:hypothetical protein